MNGVTGRDGSILMHKAKLNIDMLDWPRRVVEVSVKRPTPLTVESPKTK